MDLLFSPTVEPNDVPPIPGLHYRSKYLTGDQERQLADLVDREPWDESWQRRRQLFGASYGPGRQDIERPIPSWGLDLIARLVNDRIAVEPFDQMLINEYQPGQGIALHRDYEPFDRTVVSLSLLSACIMDFRRVADDERRSLLLEPRSLLVLSDEARYDWEHGIAKRKADVWHGWKIVRERRLSITFRRRKLSLGSTQTR